METVNKTDPSEDRRSSGRRGFLSSALHLAAGAALSGLGPLAASAGTRAGNEGNPMPSPVPSSGPPPARFPVLFVGHGSPMNAIEDNEWSRGFRRLASLLPRPKAILAVSAHWFVPGTYTTGNPRPETIHDFGGFPPELYAMEYPAPGDPDFARRVARLIGEDRASVRTDWGLDHGTWSVLHHLRPDADVPVVQLSVRQDLPPAQHAEIGRILKELRGDGVLLIGSGNITHNLAFAFRNYARGDLTTPDWAARFDAEVAKALEQKDSSFLARVVETDYGRRCHPTLDHYLPLLYTVGAAEPEDAVRFPLEGFDLGSLSMRAAIFGQA